MSKAPLLPQHNDYRYGAAPPIRFPRANQNHARDSDSDRPAAPQGSSEEVRIPDWVSSLPPVNDQGKRVLHHSNPRDYGRLKKKMHRIPKVVPRVPRLRDQVLRAVHTHHASCIWIGWHFVCFLDLGQTPWLGVQVGTERNGWFLDLGQTPCLECKWELREMDVIANADSST